VRRERPHPGAQLEIFDTDGYRYTAFITDQPDIDIAALEPRHRRRARVEDAIRTGKETGMRSLPFAALRTTGFGSSSLRSPRSRSALLTSFARGASSPLPSPSGSASARRASPGASFTPPDARRFARNAAGLGRRPSPRPSRGRGRRRPERGHGRLSSRHRSALGRKAATARVGCFSLTKQKARPTTRSHSKRVRRTASSAVTCLTLANYTRRGENGESGLVRNCDLSESRSSPIHACGWPGARDGGECRDHVSICLSGFG
jgi:hypothetical protein